MFIKEGMMKHEKLRDLVDGLLLAKFTVQPNNVDMVTEQTVNEIAKIVTLEWPQGRSDCPIRPLVIDQINHLFRQGRLEIRDGADRCLGIAVMPQRLRLVVDNTQRPT